MPIFNNSSHEEVRKAASPNTKDGLQMTDDGMGIKFTEMTQAQYDALTPTQKEQSGFVLITDGEYSAPNIYLHTVAITLQTAGGADWGHAHLNIWKAGNTPFTIETFRAWLQNRGEVSMTGKGKTSTAYDIALVCIAYADAATTTNPVQVFSNPGEYYTRSISNITDTVSNVL